MKLKCFHCGKEFEKPDWYVNSKHKRGQEVFFCSHKCHNTKRTNDLCRDNKIIQSYLLKYGGTIEKMIVFYQNRIDDIMLKDKIQQKAMIALCEYPLYGKNSVLSYIRGALEHCLKDCYRKKRKSLYIENCFTDNNLYGIK